MDFVIRAIFLPRRRVKKTSNKHSVLPLTFLISVLKFGGTRTNKAFCYGKHCFCYIIHKCVKSRWSYFDFATF